MQPFILSRSELDFLLLNSFNPIFQYRLKWSRKKINKIAKKFN